MPGGPDREHTPPPASDPTDAQPLREKPQGARKSAKQESCGEKLTKSLTAKTEKTRYRDPLRTPDAAPLARAELQKMARSGNRGEKKLSKSL